MKWLRMPIEHIPQLTVSWCYIYQRGHTIKTTNSRRWPKICSQEVIVFCILIRKAARPSVTGLVVRGVDPDGEVRQGPVRAEDVVNKLAGAIEICLCVGLQHRVQSHDHVREDECGRMYAAIIDLEFAVDAGVVEADTAAGVVDAEREGEHRIRPVLRVHGNVAVDDIDVEVIGAGDHVEGVHGGHDDDHRHGGGHSVA